MRVPSSPAVSARARRVRATTCPDSGSADRARPDPREQRARCLAADGSPGVERGDSVGERVIAVGGQPPHARPARSQRCRTDRELWTPSTSSHPSARPESTSSTALLVAVRSDQVRRQMEADHTDRVVHQRIDRNRVGSAGCLTVRDQPTTSTEPEEEVVEDRAGHDSSTTSTGRPSFASTTRSLSPAAELSRARSAASNSASLRLR